jgi:malate dehydrogenase (oxaloacetate-decarboxylating)
LARAKPHDDPGKKALSYSKFYAGKIMTAPKVPVRSLSDFSIWYTPGVAAVSMAVHEDPDLSFEYTNRWNTIAVLTNGSRVLGLGNIGPEASLPVMEGKALIYKYLGGVDAIPIPIRVTETEQFIATAKALEPALGGINLEDIESPKCFEILERLRKEMNIAVWHDDQQGTAGVSLAGLYNALKVTDRELRGTRIVLMGAGAANIATARLLMAAGSDPADLILVDSKGALHPEREDIDQLSLRNRWKYDLAIRTNGDRVTGGIGDALQGADALVAAAKPGPGTLTKKEVAGMGPRSIVFLLANPVPEMWPEDALAAGAEVVATGRSDYPNQVNNSLLFPAIFRGALDVRAKTITDPMVIVAAKELAAAAAGKGGISKKRILPTMMEWEVYVNVAAAVGVSAQAEGQARRRASRKELMRSAHDRIQHSRTALAALRRSGVIPDPPE